MTPDACLESPEAELHKALVGLAGTFVRPRPGYRQHRRVVFLGRYNLDTGRLKLLANWPFTLFAIMPTNTHLKAGEPADAGQ
jgi:hypothetical protein